MSGDDLLTTFTQAEAETPYRLAARWAAPSRRPSILDRTAEHELDELATMAALAAWLTRWLPLQIHRALLAGATIDQAAAATGLEPAEVAARWRDWSAKQRLHLPDGIEAPAFDQVERVIQHAAVERIRQQANGGDQ